MKCPAGTLFNTATKVCDFPYNVQCKTKDKVHLQLQDVASMSQKKVDKNGAFEVVAKKQNMLRL